MELRLMADLLVIVCVLVLILFFLIFWFWYGIHSQTKKFDDKKNKQEPTVHNNQTTIEWKNPVQSVDKFWMKSTPVSWIEN